MEDVPGFGEECLSPLFDVVDVDGPHAAGQTLHGDYKQYRTNVCI